MVDFFNELQIIINFHQNKFENIESIKTGISFLIESINDQVLIKNIFNKKDKNLENGFKKLCKLKTNYKIKLEFFKVFSEYINFQKIDLLDLAIMNVCGHINDEIKEYIISILNKKENENRIEIEI
jgi:hypothetical protein